jgi:hypothetical protein
LAWQVISKERARNLRAHGAMRAGRIIAAPGQGCTADLIATTAFVKSPLPERPLRDTQGRADLTSFPLASACDPITGSSTRSVIVVAEREFAEHALALAWAEDDAADEDVQRVEYLGPEGDWRWAGALKG